MQDQETPFRRHHSGHPKQPRLSEKEATIGMWFGDPGHLEDAEKRGAAPSDGVPMARRLLLPLLFGTERLYMHIYFAHSHRRKDTCFNPMCCLSFINFK